MQQAGSAAEANADMAVAEVGRAIPVNQHCRKANQTL
jgi:hypothetical protein